MNAVIYSNCSEDYYVGQASNWMMSQYIDEAKEHVLNTIGVDITSATDREELACRAYRKLTNWAKTLKTLLHLFFNLVVTILAHLAFQSQFQWNIVAIEFFQN